MVLTFTPSPCAVCKQMDPDNRLLTCYGCGISVHDGKEKIGSSFKKVAYTLLLDCYGANLSGKKGWHCDVCVNKKNPTASYVSELRMAIVMVTKSFVFRNIIASYATNQRTMRHSRSSKQPCTTGCMYYVRCLFLKPDLSTSTQCNLWNT